MRQSFVFILNRLCSGHVVDDVGRDRLRIRDRQATVIASGYKDGLDLAVLKVDGLSDLPALNLYGSGSSGDKGTSVLTAGFDFADDRYSLKPLQGTLGDRLRLQSRVGSDSSLGFTNSGLYYSGSQIDVRYLGPAHPSTEIPVIQPR